MVLSGAASAVLLVVALCAVGVDGDAGGSAPGVRRGAERMAITKQCGGAWCVGVVVGTSETIRVEGSPAASQVEDIRVFNWSLQTPQTLHSQLELQTCEEARCEGNKTRDFTVTMPEWRDPTQLRLRYVTMESGANPSCDTSADDCPVVQFAALAKPEITNVDESVYDAIVSSAVSVSVVATDANRGTADVGSNIVSLDMTSVPPSGASFGAYEYQCEEGTSWTTGGQQACGNRVRRIFTWTPSPADAVCASPPCTARVCFQAVDNTAEKWLADQNVGDLSSDEVCVNIHVHANTTSFVAPTPNKPGQNNSLYNTRLYLNAPATVVVRAQIDRTSVDLTVAVETLPTGASWSESTSVAPPVAGVTAVQRTLTWTPARGQEGQSYTVCATAGDNLFGPRMPPLSPHLTSERWCFVLEVVRCVYAAGADDTLKSIAARFRTDWLQLWIANQQLWNANSVTQNSISNPDHIPAGTLLKLGPTYKARAEDRVDHLAVRFGMTVTQLLSLNPDVPQSHHLNAEQEMCITPGICGDTV